MKKLGPQFRRAFFLTCLIGLAVSFPLSASADFIPIINNSFENPVLADSDYQYVMPGWNVVGLSGVWNPAVAQSSATFVSGIPDGSQVAFSNNGTISQTLPAILELGYTYTLTVYVGGRPDYSGVNFAVILAGTATLAQVTGTNVVDTWTPYSVSFAPLTGDPRLGQLLSVQLFNLDGGVYGGVQLDYDLITLERTATAVPEAGILILLGISMMSVVGLRRWWKE